MKTTSTNKSLVSHIENERGRCATARNKLHELINLWYSVYEMDASSLKRNLPFPNASAAFQPLLFDEVRVVYGQLWAMQFKHKPLLSVEPAKLNATTEDVDMAAQVQFAMDHVLHNEMDIREKAMPVTLEGLLCGMAVVHIPWAVRSRMTPIRLMGQEVTEFVPQIVYNNPDFEHVPLAHFEWPPEAPTLPRARWCLQHLYYTADELLDLVASGMLDKKAVMELIKGGTDKPSEWSQKYGELIGQDVPISPQYHLIDWWGWWTDKKSQAKMWNCVYQPDTGLELLKRPNPYDDQSFPFATWALFPRPGKMLGIGAGRILTDLNGVLNELWNQRINAGRIANTKVFLIRKGSGIKPSEKIYPGKRIYTANPAQDIHEMSMGDVKNSSYADANDIWSVADRVLSTGEYMHGQQSISRPNASGQMSLIDIAQENASVAGDGLRTFWGRVGKLVYSRLRQFAPPSKLLPNLAPDLAGFYLPILSPDTFKFDLFAADQRSNPEAERQKLSTAYQMYTGYYQMLMQYAQLLDNPQTPPTTREVAMKAISAITELMKRIGRSLNMQGFEKFIVEVPDAAAGSPGVPNLPQGLGGALPPGAQRVLPANAGGAQG